MISRNEVYQDIFNYNYLAPLESSEDSVALSGFNLDNSLDIVFVRPITPALVAA